MPFIYMAQLLCLSTFFNKQKFSTMKITIFSINFLMIFAFSQFSLSANSGLISCEIKGDVEVCTSSEKVYVYTLDAPVMSGQTVRLCNNLPN